MAPHGRSVPTSRNQTLGITRVEISHGRTAWGTLTPSPSSKKEANHETKSTQAHQNPPDHPRPVSDPLRRGILGNPHPPPLPPARIMKTDTNETPVLPLAQRITQGGAIVNTDLSFENGKPALIWTSKGPGYGAICHLDPEWTAKDPRHFNEANALLIQEAFNVTHETGRTPRDLANDRAELLEILVAIAGSGTLHDAQVFAREAFKKH